MRILESRGKDEIATVFVGDLGGDRLVEFVESVQPPIPRDEKWVLIVSVLLGCPVRCPICDAGDKYLGPLSQDEILAQIDHLIRRRYPSGRVPVSRLKIQFARMGEPALNPAVLDVIDRLPDLYDVPGLIPSISTIAPKGSEGFFARLAEIKHSRFGQGRFQLQFSIHSSDEQTRARLIPMPHWSFPEISAYGERFAEAEDRKITLNFALAEGIPIEAFELRRHFDPGRFLIKVTPINPTLRAAASGLRSRVDASHPERTYGELQALEDAGFDVLLSIGELEENRIGSNCGQFVQRILHGSRSEQHPVGSYTYWHPHDAS